MNTNRPKLMQSRKPEPKKKSDAKKPTAGVRLQKFLATTGVSSRRKAEDLIREGRVKVNGKRVDELGVRIDPKRDRVDVDGKPVQPKKTVWIAFHKPRGYLTSRGDTHGRRTIYDVLPPELHELFYVGRLDRDSEGLLLLTNDGDTAHAMLHPSYEMERVYRARVEGDISTGALRRLERGVELEDGVAHAHQVRKLRDAPEGQSAITITLTEGRKREVRRMLEAVGHPVKRLIRTKYGPISLDDLKPGTWRPLTRQEIAALPRKRH